MFKRRKTYTDQDIISFVKKGESNKVLLFLYEQTQPKITNWILKNSGTVEEAQDVFQDSVVVLYQYIVENKFKEKESIEGFLYSVAKNKWINRAKQQKNTIYLSKDISIDENEIVEAEGDFKNIELLLEQLGKTCKELLVYSIFYKMTMEDIALRMSFSNANAAKTKNYKCKQRLVKLVKDKKSLLGFLYNE